MPLQLILGNASNYPPISSPWKGAQPDPLGREFVGDTSRFRDWITADGSSGFAAESVLWDKQSRRIVNNESSDIIRLLDSEFNSCTPERRDFYPPALRADIDEINARVYETVNDGVYRAGFATSQATYESAVKALFASLDRLEERLATGRYLLGNVLTEVDWRLFPTLARFDAVYYGHFKCSVRHVYEYPALWDYTRELYQMEGIAATVAIDEYKSPYYASHRGINPAGIVPIGPVLDFTAPHERGLM